MAALDDRPRPGREPTITQGRARRRAVRRAGLRARQQHLVWPEDTIYVCRDRKPSSPLAQPRAAPPSLARFNFSGSSPSAAVAVSNGVIARNLLSGGLPK
jgi:hypothetical protein